MNERDWDGFRLRPDGERFELIVEYFFQADIPQEMYDLAAKRSTPPPSGAGCGLW